MFDMAHDQLVEWLEGVEKANSLQVAAEAHRLYTAAAAEEVSGQWRPIESAPKDGTQFVGYWDNDDIHVVCIRDGECRREMDGDPWRMPTFWMPLPSPSAEPSLGEVGG